MSVVDYSNELQTNEFAPGDLVIWHDPHDHKGLPIPAVVVRQQPGSVLIKARVEGALKEVQVNPAELVSR